MLNKQEQKVILDAHKHGKHIQIKTSPKAEWQDMKLPMWDFNKCEYRVKPQGK